MSRRAKNMFVNSGKIPQAAAAKGKEMPPCKSWQEAASYLSMIPEVQRLVYDRAYSAGIIVYDGEKWAGVNSA